MVVINTEDVNNNNECNELIKSLSASLSDKDCKDNQTLSVQQGGSSSHIGGNAAIINASMPPLELLAVSTRQTRLERTTTVLSCCAVLSSVWQRGNKVCML
jgi:hypothetical protein